MRKPTTLLLLVTLLFSSVLVAQKLQLDIEGASIVETEIINNFNYNKSHIDIKAIINEVNSLQKKILKAGYIESERSSIKKKTDSTYYFNFKLNTKYETIKIYYDATKIDKRIINGATKNSFDNYFTIAFTDIENIMYYINKESANKGFPFSKIKLSEIKKENNKTLKAKLVINNGERKRGLDQIVIKGYTKFPKTYLKRFLKIKPNATFNIDEITKKVNALNNLQFANQIKPPEILFTKDSTQLYLYIEKTNSNTFDGFIGFSTNEQTNKLDFNGYLDLNLVNNFNYGESLKLLYKNTESDQNNFEAELNLPYILGTPIGSELGINIFKQDSSFTTVKQKVKLFYQLNSKSKLFAGIETINSNSLLGELSTEFINDYKTNFYSFRYDFENRKNYSALYQLNTMLSFESAIGTRETKNIKEKQTKLNLNAHHIFHLNNKNSIFLRVNASLLTSKNHFENELLRFGGINSIRGFQENSLLATQYAVFNTEYRYKLSNTIYAHSIIDFANLNNKINNDKKKLYGLGLGFGLLTKAGLLRFNYANGKNNKQPFKLSNSKIHLSLTTLF